MIYFCWKIPGLSGEWQQISLGTDFAQAELDALLEAIIREEHHHSEYFFSDAYNLSRRYIQCFYLFVALF